MKKKKKKKKERLADKFLLHNYCVAISSMCIFSNKYDESVIVHCKNKVIFPTNYIPCNETYLVCSTCQQLSAPYKRLI